MTQGDGPLAKSSFDRLMGPPGDLAVEVDGHPLIPVDPSHFTPEERSEPQGEAPRGKRRDGRRFRRRLLILTVVLMPLLLLGLVAVGGGLYLQHKLDSRIDRFDDPFASIPASERPAATGDAQNILLLGSDSRISAGDPKNWTAGAQRTDAIMILHIPANRGSAYVTSIPRDSWVTIPGHGKNKINAAFSFGGPALTVRTVEKLTGVRIDHVMIADFSGFSSITDAVGGVNITVPASSGVAGANVPAGKQLMDGKTALLYVRERHHLPGGDFDRVKRQQNWIRAIASKTLSGGVLKHPKQMYTVLSEFTSMIQVDQNFSIGDMRSLALSMREVRSDDLHFLTVPVAGTGWSPDGRQSIVKLDIPAAKALFTATAADQVSFWAAKNNDALLGNNVR